MNIVRYLVIILVALSPPILLLTYNKSGVEQAENKPQPPRQAKNSTSDQHQKQVEEGLKAYQKYYQEELAAHQQDVTGRWGEFKESSPSQWVSYEQPGNVRRSVDYQTGKVEVEMLVDKGTAIDQVKTSLDMSVFRLMNATERDAYDADVVAGRVEQRLARFEQVLEKGELSDDRLFSMNDLLSLQMNHDGYLKVRSRAKNVATTDVRPANKAGKDIVRVSFRIPHSIHEKAAKYAAAVISAAEKEKINDELIYAIMETESSFNPMAKSHIPAYGLMQIVPRTAGKDATNYLFGKAKILAPSYLYKPENNIKIGAAYLHVLHYKYMRKVKDMESRMYCAIAAYNTGATNVARAFINQASFNKAVPEINKLSSAEVYQKLKKYLPRQETRNYIEKVAKRMQKYL